EALESFGAKAFADVAEAVKGAERVHLTLKDDVSVDEVLSAAKKGLKPGAVIVDHTTTSVAGAVKRTQAWADEGVTYIHAPVFMGPPNALESTGFMLVSGDQALVNRMDPVLSSMTGKLLNFGPETGKAAGMKLLGNSFLVGFTASIADTLMLAKSLQIPVSDLATLFDVWNPGAMLPARLKRMTSGNYQQPSWELSMARKDTGLFLQAAMEAGIPLTVLPAVAKLMDKWIEKGQGGSDWTVIGSEPLK
ncbi:MAG: NAD(P)-dependent oxidoreductase, partial [Bacteroidetes bacterium]|nr:NAD(P)-dependent oxidoreductase [Bacteroidota bacterium]